MNWKNITVAEDLSHHILEGKPLYNDRFDEVLKFHQPGLAPVLRDGEAWHINENGIEAYSRRFHRTFGFYEGSASVIDESGAYHVKADGLPLYDARFLWTGNFQEGKCPVRRSDGSYVHILPNGAPLSDHVWKYVGDFKDGIAVVQSDEGLSTHISHTGSVIHNTWYLDLDVFHKSFARGKDKSGWCHINRNGSPAYEHRYAMIEPFYNGMARVETFNGSLLIIDEEGAEVCRLR